jgi:GNAT superfamily N-acetyltransferase
VTGRSGRSGAGALDREDLGPRLRIVPATEDRWPDIELVLDGDNERGCWCQPWRGAAGGYGRAPVGSRPAALRAQLSGAVPPGFLAYLDDQVVGWCGVVVRTEAPRLTRSRTIPAIDDAPVWAIGCFRIRVGYRRRGVARALLAHVVRAARTAGAPGVEAYPIDPEGGRVDVGFAYVGIASMFDAAGFRRVLETGARSAGLPRLLVRLDFDPG